MAQDDNESRHYDQTPRRKAEFINPPNTLKSKVGYGGLADEILEKAQKLLENNAADFMPLAEMYLSNLMKSIAKAENAIQHREDQYIVYDNSEELIAGMLYPAMQLKANGSLFRFPLVTKMGDKLIQFLEVIKSPDPDALEIVSAFHTSIRAVVMGGITGEGDRYARELVEALNQTCRRYFAQHPDNKSRPIDPAETF